MLFPAKESRPRGSGLAPAAEDEAAEREAEPERAEREAADRDALRHVDSRCQRPSASCSSAVSGSPRRCLRARRRPGGRGRGRRRSRADSSAIAIQSIACVGRADPPPPRLRPALGRNRRPTVERALAAAGRARPARSSSIASGDLTHRGRATSTTVRPLPALARAAGARDPGQPRHPVHVPRPLHEARSRSSSGLGDDRAGSRREALLVVGLNSVRPGATSRAALRASSSRARRAPRRGARRARSGSSTSTITWSARRGARARSRSRRRTHVLAGSSTREPS